METIGLVGFIKRSLFPLKLEPHADISQQKVCLKDKQFPNTVKAFAFRWNMIYSSWSRNYRSVYKEPLLSSHLHYYSRREDVESETALPTVKQFSH